MNRTLNAAPKQCVSHFAFTSAGWAQASAVALQDPGWVTRGVVGARTSDVAATARTWR
jgi:hypothetical protein